MTDPLRLFLVADDDDVALLIRKTLERVGHQVSRCRTAADALIVLAQSTFDLVLVEQALPDASGLDLLNALGREGVAAPAVIVAAGGDEQLAARALRAGALDYLVQDDAMTFLAELPKRVAESVTRHRLEQLNDLLIQALESARDGVLITDLQGTILHVNRALESLTGYDRRELIGQNPRLLKSNAHPPSLYAEMWRTVLARGSWQGELTNRRKDGTLFQASLTVSPIVDGRGRLTHFVGIQRDVTYHKQLERQLLQAQKMHSVGTLAGGIAHEFNNLLAGINGYAALGLRERGLTATLAEFLKHVVDLSERAAGLTRQLLAFARKPALTRQVTDMPDLARRTAELVTRTLRRPVTLDVADAGRDGRALAVRADANQLQQALVNLALNARDALEARETAATPRENPGSRPLTFRVRHAPLDAELVAFPQHVPPGDFVVLEVEDEGSGMAPDVLAQSVDPFFTTKDVGRGTGLGLPVVFGIVQGHQGYLTIDSAPARGTRAALYLPREPEPVADEQPEAPELSTEVLEPESTPGRSILVIDDEEAVLDVVRRFLEIAGHRVTCVTRGEDALGELAAGREVDLVILDLMMPHEDVAATFQRLRQRRPGVPVLLCTGLPQAERATELLAQPGVALIRKPFRMNELWYAVRQALQSSQ
jgi:PAS domain S-box-containing protein